MDASTCITTSSAYVPSAIGRRRQLGTASTTVLSGTATGNKTVTVRDPPTAADGGSVSLSSSRLPHPDVLPDYDTSAMIQSVFGLQDNETDSSHLHPDSPSSLDISTSVPDAAASSTAAAAAQSLLMSLAHGGSHLLSAGNSSTSPTAAALAAVAALAHHHWTTSSSSSSSAPNSDTIAAISNSINNTINNVNSRNNQPGGSASSTFSTPHSYLDPQQIHSNSALNCLSVVMANAQLAAAAAAASSSPYPLTALSSHLHGTNDDNSNNSSNNNNSGLEFGHQLPSQIFVEQMVAAAAAAAAAQAHSDLALCASQDLYDDDSYQMAQMHPNSGGGGDTHNLSAAPRSLSSAASSNTGGVIIPEITIEIPGGDIIVVRQNALGKYCCHLCDHSFSRLFNLRSHLNTHSRLKPFQCGSCNKQFSRNHDLTRHQRTHSKEKGHRCQVCGREFARRDALKRHLRMDKDARKAYCSDLANVPESTPQSKNVVFDDSSHFELQDLQKQQKQHHQLHRQQQHQHHLQQLENFQAYQAHQLATHNTHLQLQNPDERFHSHFRQPDFQLQLGHHSVDVNHSGVLDMSNATSQDDFNRAVMVIEEATAAAVVAATALAFNTRSR
ncbi:hypothetical protein BASA61_000031 [Batrachochytrium salamandrivorans]|nr:hypothetical protein BASA61_000031 [Batrachochytrium salamandrivorans]